MRLAAMAIGEGLLSGQLVRNPCSSDTYCVPVLLFTTQQKKYFTEKLP